MHSSIGALVLAAGKGTRMHSDQPKVLRTLLGEPMLGYVLDGLAPLFGQRVHVVIGHGADQVRKAFPGFEGRFILQEQQLGTGHALQCAWQALTGAGYSHVLVMNGDVPLAAGEDLRAFVDQALGMEADVAFLSIQLDNPGAYGRVARDASGGVSIVEAKDYDQALYGPATGEINAGIYLLRLSAVEPVLFGLNNANKSGEFYITDLAGLVGARGGLVAALNRGRDEALLGINNPRELAMAEEGLRRKIIDKWFDKGVLIRAAESVRIGPHVRLEPGAEVSGPCDILGHSTISAQALLEPHVWINNSTVAAGAVVHAFSHVEGAVVGPACHAGPFARLRPGAVLQDGARVGNFVEMKKAVLGPGAKAGHLAYLGDTTVGAGANIGAGTITCNYDGKNKFNTTIGAGAFIGSNSSLVAPVTIGAGALVGAGSVITKEVPDDALAFGRSRQVTKERRKKPS